jgi:hypothetical protein
MITAAVVSAERGLQGVEVAERQLAVARQARTEAVQIAGVARGVDRRVRAAVERAVEADDVDPLGLAVDHVVAARGLQGALDRLGARIGEEHHVGEGGRAQLVGQHFLLGDRVDVGDVPELLALGLQRLDQHRVGVAQAAGGDAGHAVQVLFAGGREQARASASLERQRGAVVDAHDVVLRGVRRRRTAQDGLPKRKEAPVLKARGPEGPALSARKPALSTNRP